MDLYDVLFVTVVALVFGTLAQLTSGYSRGGWIVHMGLGFLGASMGVAIARSFRVPLIFVITIMGREFPIIWAVIGAVFFLAAIGFLVSPNRR
jgi:uncharacterized membrane protein YeaQ/YmgE (transglycosylase-associated protein family)